MKARIVQGRHKMTQAFRSNRHTPPNSFGPRYIDLIDVNDQLLAIPLQTAGSNFKVMCRSIDVLTPPFGHGPTPPAFTIQGNIQGAEILRICFTALKAPSQSVIRRKNATHKCNDRQTVLAIIAQRIDIPPEITTRLDLLIKPRSSINVAAANRPDMAAMGRPGPG